MTPADVAQVLELTTNQVDVLTDVLSALSFANSPAPSAGGSSVSAPLGQEDIYLHELSLFLLAQLFSKEAQRADAVEYWPDPNSNTFAAAVAAGSSAFGASQELLSPTRRSQPAGAWTRRSPGLELWGGGWCLLFSLTWLSLKGHGVGLALWKWHLVSV